MTGALLKAGDERDVVVRFVKPFGLFVESDPDVRGARPRYHCRGRDDAGERNTFTSPALAGPGHLPRFPHRTWPDPFPAHSGPPPAPVGAPGGLTSKAPLGNVYFPFMRTFTP